MWQAGRGRAGHGGMRCFDWMWWLQIVLVRVREEGEVHEVLARVSDTF